MKTALVRVPSEITAIDDDGHIEIWYDGQVIGTIHGLDGPGVQIVTKHAVGPIRKSYEGNTAPITITVHIDPTQEA